MISRQKYLTSSGALPIQQYLLLETGREILTFGIFQKTLKLQNI